ncbi:hypothetical protein [Amycolatopsis minnesotensis]|uniref:Polyketide cyclase / dehydrase and lipid transport n=1 Tax=Amycolatopsis minnesotensis TaxID=337894 RepID=A0ABN2RUX1_9PSEU
MQRSWTISGTYATWKMTVDIEPPDEPARLDGYCVKEWPAERLAPVIGHFFEAVNFYELSRDAEDTMKSA